MTTKEMRERLIDEIRGIPDTRVAEVYNLIHLPKREAISGVGRGWS